MPKLKKASFTVPMVSRTKGMKTIDFTTIRSTPAKKQSHAALRDLNHYLIRKEQLERRYSKSNITFP